MNWQEICERSDLQDLPFKIETNQFGQIVMSPASNQDGFLQARLSYLLLSSSPEGSRVISECSIQTSDGTKVSDVSWLSDEFWKTHGTTTPLPSAPELCIEIQSPSNSRREMDFKTALYFEAGASEVWICDESGSLTFIVNREVSEKSNLFPDVPASI